MSTWKRVGPKPEIFRVNFVVRSSKREALTDWLHELPYQGISSNIIGAIEFALQNGFRGDAPKARRRRASDSSPDQSGNETFSATPSQVETRPTRPIQSDFSSPSQPSHLPKAVENSPTSMGEVTEDDIAAMNSLADDY